MEEFKYKVYVRLDENNCITVVESDLTLKDTTEYVQIDEGTGINILMRKAIIFQEISLQGIVKVDVIINM